MPAPKTGGLPGIPAPKAGSLPATKPGSLLGLGGGKPAVAAAPAHRYYIPQNFRDQKAKLRSVLSDPDKNPSGLVLDDGQIDQLIGLMVAAHAKHAKG